MNKFVHYFHKGIQRIRNNLYERIKSVDNLRGMYSLDFHDLSALDLSAMSNLFTDQYPKDNSVIGGWTENVIWPTQDKMPQNFNPTEILKTSKHPLFMDELHKKNITGRGVNVAIIDTTLNRDHPEYAHAIKYYSENDTLRDTPNTHPVMHGSLVCSALAGKECGTAPDVSIFYFADGMKGDFNQQLIALKKVLDLQKKLPDKDKIRILSCSFGIEANSTGTKNTPECIAETHKVLQELHDSGILVIQCDGKEFFNFNPKFGPQKTDTISIPTDARTFAYYKGGYKYGNSNGDSAAAPYLAGVIACALQGNQIFCTRPNWIDEIKDIMKRTATESENGGKIVNPYGIVNAVSEIARTMEIQLIKQQSIQHE
ncbi:MAG: S8 family serine peptidase [Alphaproteobacteria bacterium]|nr:S8 family serine peptidase [Alphaproteobacteria bacterium]